MIENDVEVKAMKKKYRKERKKIEVKAAAKVEVKTAPVQPKAAETVAVSCSVSERNIFCVFQNNTFEQESKGGYIWAPVTNAAGKKFHYWDRLLDVKAGDILLHSCNGCIQAVSTASGVCYDYDQAEEKGRRVDCNYVVIENAIKTADYTEDILRICTMKQAPFDKRGRGNTGYLYEMPRELAKIFLNASIENNASLKEVDYVAGLLAE